MSLYTNTTTVNIETFTENSNAVWFGVEILNLPEQRHTAENETSFIITFSLPVHLRYSYQTRNENGYNVVSFPYPNVYVFIGLFENLKHDFVHFERLSCSLCESSINLQMPVGIADHKTLVVIGTLVVVVFSTIVISYTLMSAYYTKK